MKILSFLGRARRISLNLGGLLTFTGDVGQTMSGACPVIALFEDDLQPATGIAIRYRVITGPLQFTPNDSTEARVKTDSNGNASVDAVFTSTGSAIIVAELADNPDIAVFFGAHSQEATDQLFIYADPTFPVDPGMVTARVVALDHHGRPVTGAHIVFEGAFATDMAISGEVKELGNGEYEGNFKTNIAGCWNILAQDVDTKVTAHTCIHILPGKPHSLRLVGETDPRMSAPFGELLLRVRLEDDLENALDPHRIRCTGAGLLISPQNIVAEEARFPIRFAGYGFVDVLLSDNNSEVATRMTIPFAAAWLENPGAVFAKSTFRTALYGALPPGGPSQRAIVEIEFDPKLVTFVQLEDPPPGGPGLSTIPAAEGNLLTITVESTKPITAQEYPDGIPVCTIVWKCQDEGQVCFELVGRMSPSTPKWEMCLDQKKREQKCICINVIYKKGDAAAKTAGTNAANQVPAIISSNANVTQCCPIVKVGIKYCRIKPADWTNKIVPAIGADEKMSSLDEARALDRVNPCLAPKCINMSMIAWNHPTIQGATDIGPPGNSSLDPGTVGTVANVGAHEVGHALGLTHASSGGVAGNLMHDPQPHGTDLTKDQCKTIWENIDNYPC